MKNLLLIFKFQTSLKKIKKRSIQYVKMDYIQNYSFLNNALLVAGNFSDADSLSWPVTPVWTSKWLMDELSVYGFNQVDTAFFHLQNQLELIVLSIPYSKQCFEFLIVTEMGTTIPGVL